MTESKKKIDLPFRVIKSEVSGGFIDSVHSAYTGGIDIVNYHEDKYGNLDEAVLQSPFTEQWVGGKQHRHVALNDGVDTAETRQEAWHLEFTGSGVRFSSHKKLNSPPAYWSREGLAKRPLNIANISNKDLYLGNFSKNYQVVQTSGRRITNNLIVDGYEAGGVLTTQFITGAADYSLPDLNTATGSKSVIVERFNSPGSKQESSRGALDREGEEYSPNSPLPYRNIKIRQPFYNQLAQSTPQFGGTIHNVNRNTLVRGGNEQKDNGFVVHSLPRTDIQYSWISSSSPISASELGGYQSFGGEYNRSESYTDILFNSGSLVLSGAQEYFVDNFGINSLVKDQKSIDLDTKTFSISSSLSASFSEYTNSGYTFTTWTSLRNAENPVAKSLRKSNIISVQSEPKEKVFVTSRRNRVFVKSKRGETSENFIDPPVTSKYRPLRHRFVFKNVENEEVGHELEHTYSNNLSTFSNKQLLERLSSKENKEQFYNIVLEYYTNPESQQVNPIEKFLGYTYTETVWPREEKTGLNKTRKRAEYYLNKAGFTRDGYDIQLGTQRSFWRNLQSDRKRSKNSEGGYYSSINYLSTEETGSNFVQNETGVLSNNKPVSFSSSLSQSSNIEQGIFNSRALLEKVNQEKFLFSYTGSISSEYKVGTSTVNQIYADIVKNGYSFDTSGEFNNMFVDFYEQIKDQNVSYKKSIGALYRGTSYKSLLNSLPEERSSYEDFALKTEDEEIFANPKLKYVAFIGGGELNTSDFIQSESNFTGDFRSFEGVQAGKINDIHRVDDDFYIAGTFKKIDTQTVNGVAKWDETTNTWDSFGNGILQTTYVEVYKITLSGSDIYAGHSQFGVVSSSGVSRWDATASSWESIGTSSAAVARDIAFSGSDIYITNNTSDVFRWDGASWTNIPITASSALSLLLSGSDIYAGPGSSGTSAVWRLSGSTWLDTTPTSAPTFTTPIEVLKLSGSTIYAGSEQLYYLSGTYPSTSQWTQVGTISDSAQIKDIAFYENDIYVSGEGDGPDYNVLWKYDGDSATWSAIEDFGPIGNLMSVNGLSISGSYLYVVGEGFSEPGSLIVKRNLTTGVWEKIITQPNYNTFNTNYFSQSFNSSSFSFSTMDNGLQRTTEVDSGKKPFFDSYEDFVEDIRAEAKSFSIIPEFRISENMDFYVSQNDKNFRTKNKSFLSLDGIGENYRSANTKISNYNQDFIKSYATSDILKKHDNIRKENEKVAEVDYVHLKVSGIKKMLPYNGFYPQDRITQVANLYSSYIDNNLHGGVYNLSYRNDYANENVIQTSASLTSISVARSGNKHYMAVGQPGADTAGRVDIYTSSVNDPTSWSPIVQSLTNSIGDAGTDFGQKVQMISASNGLNLFIGSQNYDNLAVDPGFVLLSTSSNGESWSDPQALYVKDTYPSIYVSGSSTGSTGFADFFDISYNKNDQEEKIVMIIGAPFASGIAGEVYTVTGSLVDSEWEWSNKVLVHTGSATTNQAGLGVSIVSCSSGYQGFMAELLGDQPNLDNGTLWVTTSSNGQSWSTPVYIASGSTFPQARLGMGNIKAVDFNNKTHVFFAEPRAEIASQLDDGAVFVVTSSTGNQWPATSSFVDKRLLYYTGIENDKVLSDVGGYNIEAFSGSDGRLTYAFANRTAGPPEIGEFVIGYTDGADYWQTSDSGELLIIQETTSSFSTVAVAPYVVGDYELPIFFTNVSGASGNDIYVAKNNVFTEYALKVSGSDKYYKHAALEPFFAPGIIYNTIKSGIAVDWPCATGSNTAIVPYGGSTIVNAYYPESFEMASFNGTNIYESMYGQLRSNIDYRIPFENILFPNEAFKAKSFLQNDLISKTVLTTLEPTDPLVEFVNQTYVYGGYEPYISSADFSDVDNLGPKRFSVPFVYRKEGTADTGLYTLAMSNFLAETVKFFLKDEKMVTFTSDPDNKWKQFNSNKTYYMDIVLEKSPNLVMMEAYHSDLHPTGSNGEKMNGRYFGYPVNKTDKDLWAGAEFTAEERKLIHNDPAYAPYTPPYFEGEARVRISFKPDGTSRTYTVQEIFDESTIENVFIDVAKGATTGSDAYLNKMPIGSSFDIFGAAQATEVTIDEATGEQTVRELPDTQNWIISPRMETPVLDFSQQNLESYENSYSKTSGFGRGMWSGYGRIPVSGSSIKTRLEYPFSTINSPLTASLLDQVGFKAEEKNIGTIADTKNISEAVVLIPYLEKNDRTYSDVKNKTGFNFIKIGKQNFKSQLSNIQKGKPAVPANSRFGIEQDIESTSISEMIEKMQKYVLPPEMNFLQYKDIHPFVMYIFEFEHTLTQQDLSDIWQGVMPGISTNAEKDEVTISHSSAPYEFFEGKEIPSNLRWLVFKVKKKAEINYFNVTSTTKDDARFDFNKIIGREEGTDIYSYNWPYDFFSLVEVAKVELKLDYKSKETEE